MKHSSINDTKMCHTISFRQLEWQHGSTVIIRFRSWKQYFIDFFDYVYKGSYLAARLPKFVGVQMLFPLPEASNYSNYSGDRVQSSRGIAFWKCFHFPSLNMNNVCVFDCKYLEVV